MKIQWNLSLPLVYVISVLLGGTWSCSSSQKPYTSTIQSMGNDIKWTRCFRAADGTIYFEDHRKSMDGGKTVVAQQTIDVEDINAAPERAVLVSKNAFYALDGPTKIVAPGVYKGKAWRSDDGLKTIEEEQVTFHVPEGPLRDPEDGEWYGIYVYRTILEMPDGSWLMTMYGNFTSDSIFPPDADAQRELSYMQRTFIVTSTDEGRNWNYLSTVASPNLGDPLGEGFVEPAITLLDDGRLLCIMRSGHRFPLYASWSENAGRSWSHPMYTRLDRGCDPCLITLQDGRVALSWGRRFPEGWSIVSPEGDKGRFKFPGHGYTSLSLSRDGGLTWTSHKIMKQSGTCYSTIIEVEPNVVFMLVDEWYCRITLDQQTSKSKNHIASSIEFKKHTIKPPRTTTKNNTIPNMVWVHDVDDDGQKDIIASHVGWGTIYGGVSDGADHPYVAWYKGPSFFEEFIIIDKNTPGLSGDSRIYRFVMYDVDKDGKKDLIGQGYQPFHNGNKWYKCPDNPAGPWNEWYDYNVKMQNGHDIRLRDIDGDGNMEVLLLDSHSGKMIVNLLPYGDSIYLPWPYHIITSGSGMTHYMSFFDVNGDKDEDIIIAKEEDGGKGLAWYEHPGNDKAFNQEWQEHAVVDANFTKAFARDLDEDGDIDFIGSGELDGANIGWYRNTSDGYVLHEFDKEDNNNDVNGGHNCELVDVDGDGDEDLITGGVDKADSTQRFRWYERKWVDNELKWIEHEFGVTSAPGFTPYHGFYCGEMTWSDLDNDNDIDFVYSGVGGGFLGWFENISVEGKF